MTKLNTPQDPDRLSLYRDFRRARPQAPFGEPGVVIGETFNIITENNDPLVTNGGDNLVYQ